jgi:aspartate beta-hydroxylase
VLAALETIQRESHAEAENLTVAGKWDQFTLWQHGERVERAVGILPETAKVIASLPEATSMIFGQSKLSVMAPGTHAKPHHGTTNARVRIHLGISGLEKASIRCLDETWRQWRTDACLAFDDSFEHEIWNNGTEVRVVLIVDVWQPSMTEKDKRAVMEGEPELLARYDDALISQREAGKTGL